MSKRIELPDTPETVTLPKTSVDLLFKTLEQLNTEICALRELVVGKIKKDEVLTVTEAAAYCGRTRQTINAWCRQHRIHKVERGCKVGFLTSELDRAKDL